MGLKPAKKWLELHPQQLRWGAARFPVDFPKNQSNKRKYLDHVTMFIFFQQQFMLVGLEFSFSHID